MFLLCAAAFANALLFATLSAASVFHSGAQVNLPRQTVLDEGFSQCFTDLYSNGLHDAIPSIEANCTGTIVLACFQVATPEILVAAAAVDANRFFTLTGTSNSDVICEDGVQFYHDNNWSWGFANAQDQIAGNACDQGSTNENQRICWHSVDYNIGGWRCGSTKSLNVNPSWGRVIFHKPEGSPPLSDACPTFMPTISPVVPSSAPSMNPTVLNTACRPEFGISRKECEAKIAECGNTGSAMKWTGKGTVVTARPINGPRKCQKIRVGDGGCQCLTHCGYISSGPCSRDPRCVWKGGAVQPLDSRLDGWELCGKPRALKGQCLMKSNGLAGGIMEQC